MRWEGDLNLVPDRITMFALDDAAELQIEGQSVPGKLSPSYVVLNLRGVVEDVS